MITKTSKALVAWAISRLGNPYWYGTCCYECTDNLLARKKAQYPKHYTSSRMARYKQDIDAKKESADCIGLIKGYYWYDDVRGKGVYGLDGRPDTSANGMFNKAKEFGPIDTMPDIPGLLVRYDGHIGVYIGNGYVVEARGFAYGIVKTRLKDRNWTHWMKCPYIEYDTDIQDAPEDSTPMLDMGSEGVSVVKAQERLVYHGMKLPRFGVDGKFGGEMLVAVKMFQALKQLEIDGIIGPITWAALLDNRAEVPEQIEVVYSVSIENLTIEDVNYLRETYPATRITSTNS